MPNRYENIAGTWERIAAHHENVGGTWTSIRRGWERSGGVWRLVFDAVTSIVIASDIDSWLAIEQGIELIDPIALDVTVLAGVTVRTGVGDPAAISFQGLNVSSAVTLNVEAGARVLGRGGNGGNANGGTGEDGGSAVFTRNPITINNFGTIAGGGGGGGGGGRGSVTSNYSCNCTTDPETGQQTCQTCQSTSYRQGGGGGGGAGGPGGDGGTGFNVGDPGGEVGGGAGGAPGTSAGLGGFGGSLGLAGSPGGNGNSTNGGTPGAAGAWIDGFTFVGATSGDGVTHGPEVN